MSSSRVIGLNLLPLRASICRTVLSLGKSTSPDISHTPSVLSSLQVKIRLSSRENSAPKCMPDLVRFHIYVALPSGAHLRCFPTPVLAQRDICLCFLCLVMPP